MNTIFECSYLLFAWEKGHPFSMYVTRGMGMGHPKCLQTRTGGEGYHASCVHTLFLCFSCFFRVSILQRYLKTMFYTIVIVVVTVTWCYCCRSFLTKTQNFRKNRNIKGGISSLRQFLANDEKGLKMMKNAFYFTLKAVFVVKIFKFLPWLFDDISKRPD